MFQVLMFPSVCMYICLFVIIYVSKCTMFVLFICYSLCYNLFVIRYVLSMGAFMCSVGWVGGMGVCVGVGMCWDALVSRRLPSSR